MFANPCESYKLYQPRNLGICWIYYVTPLDCSRLWDRCVLQIEKAQTRKWEETGERKGGITASALPLFPSPALIFSCVFHLRVIPTIEKLEPQSGFTPVILFNWNLNCSDILLIKLCAKDTVHYSSSKTNIPYLSLWCFDWLWGPVYVLSRVEWLATKPLTYHGRVNILWISLHNVANRLLYKQNVDERRPQISAASTLYTTGSRTVASVINHWKHELILLRWGDVGQLPFCLLRRGNDSQESSSRNPESH